MNCLSNKDEKFRLIHGRYRPQCLIGQGGIARIFLCQDTITEGRVAVKIPLDNPPESADAVRFEFAFAMTHRHPSLINPISLVDDNGLPAMVMPYVDGETPSPNKNGGPFFGAYPQCQPGPVIADILEAAAFIHFSNYIYNDFKPSNFIFRTDPSGGDTAALRPCLLDFNLVSRAGEALTRKGTIEYVAPEVLLGQPATSLSDCYSIGATIYELFAGQPPFVTDDGPRLIKLVTEDGAVDLGPIPETFRDGLRFMLARQPDKRPANMLLAARAFGVEEIFVEKLSGNIGLYISAGEPPFAAELRKAVAGYIGGRPEKALQVRGLSANYSELDFLTVQMATAGWSIERIDAGCNDDTAARILDLVLSEECPDSHCRMVVLVEDFNGLSPENRQKLRSMLRPSKWHPVIISARRWEQLDFPCLIFDPVYECSRLSATDEILRAFLKKEPDFEFSAFAAATGGEPEQVCHLLCSGTVTGQFDVFNKKLDAEAGPWIVPKIEEILAGAVQSLNADQLDTLSLLAVWGESVPMVLLTAFDNSRRGAVDSLIDLRFLKTEKGFLQYSSGNLRQFIYDRLPLQIKRQHHLYWAAAAEKFLTDDDRLIEFMALHLGRSGDLEAGYNANLAAALELHKVGDLGLAGNYASTMLDLAREGGGSISKALMLSADIGKQAGDYPTARAKYIELLRHLRNVRDDRLMAETLKDLGDLYRSQKKPAKALAYIRRALWLFERLDDAQGVANCHNNIGLILWVSQEYDKALESFFSALDLNKRLENFHEQAKIYSNVGIIKDILGKTSEVAGYFEEGYLNARKSSDPWLESLIANNLGYFHIRQNDLPKASHYLKEALRISEKIGYTENVINCLGNLGLCSLKAGDLFSSIEYNQKAIRMAEVIGNRHLGFDAELFLVEVCILMGNFSLADRVLGSVERDPVYGENMAFACQVDLLRARMWQELGVGRDSLHLVTGVRKYAIGVGDLRLKLEATLLEVKIGLENCESNAAQRLPEIVSEASALGHHDIAGTAGLALSRESCRQGDIRASELWIDRICSRPDQSRRLLLEARNVIGCLRARQGRYDEAIAVLMENETGAVGAGFLPLGLEAAGELAEIYRICHKGSKARETLSRAEAYLQQIMASLPPGISKEDCSRGPLAKRLVKLLRETPDIEFVGSKKDRP